MSDPKELNKRKQEFLRLNGNIPDFIKLIKKVNDNRDKDFIKRFFDTESIDYNGSRASHLLSYATKEGKPAWVFPLVQNIDGKLQIPDDPLESAEQRGDFIEMSNDEAEWFTKNYKNTFPLFISLNNINILLF